jgi:FlaA1/EpsC-like NDP-sugar epimerase
LTIKNDVLLVTGGTGTIGSAIVRRLLTNDPKKVIVFSRDELKQYEMKSEYLYDDRLDFFLGDVRDRNSVHDAFERVDIVFHAAALKQVPVCEAFPLEAVQTNVIGTQNVLEAAKSRGVKKVILVSTDKAVHPMATMGATKLLAERLVQRVLPTGSNPICCVCRFGNVVFSRGSVIPSLSAQIEKRHECMVTDPNMTRFVMTVDEAVNLVLFATEKSRGGEIFIPRMRSIRLADLVSAMVNVIAPSLGIDPKSVRIRRVGRRKGEKLHEELFTPEEQEHIVETPEGLIITYSGLWPPMEITNGKLASYRVSNATKTMAVPEIEGLLRSFNHVE